MNLWQVIVYVVIFGAILIGGIALLLYWLAFKKEYYTSLARYKKLMDDATPEQLNNVYNREFPADFSIKEIQEFIHGGKDDSNQSGD